MASLLWMLFGLYLLIVLLWGWGMVWVRGLGADEEMRLDPLPDADADPASPSLAIFIAAHNEQHRIGPCLDRLRRQNYGNMRITVVNDRSDDATSDGVHAVMANDPRVRLVEIHHLPEGWIGKTHALAVAAAEPEADYLLFIDCDCRLVPGAVAAVMRKMVADGLEFASLWPRLELVSSSERLMTPAASWLLGLWAFLRARRGAPNTEVRLGNGQFMLLSREAYRRIGGHAAVQAELAEDMIIAGKAAALGLKRWSGLGKGLYVTSRDNSFSSTCNALTRVLIGSLVKPWRILVSTQLLLGGVVLPAWLLPVSLYFAVADGALLAWMFTAACLFHVGAMLYVVRRLFAMTLEDYPSVLSFVVGSILSAGLLVWAWLVITGRGRIRWGNTAYRVRGSRIVAVLPETGPSTVA
ncbi:MAG: glycosyltransferase [Phycisphaerae bacterium]|nr:glycosyltransferase [Phycisphaerae bacterium]